MESPLQITEITTELEGIHLSTDTKKEEESPPVSFKIEYPVEITDITTELDNHVVKEEQSSKSTAITTNGHISKQVQFAPIVENHTSVPIHNGIDNDFKVIEALRQQQEIVFRAIMELRSKTNCNGILQEMVQLERVFNSVCNKYGTLLEKQAEASKESSPIEELDLRVPANYWAYVSTLRAEQTKIENRLYGRVTREGVGWIGRAERERLKQELAALSNKITVAEQQYRQNIGKYENGTSTTSNHTPIYSTPTPSSSYYSSSTATASNYSSSTATAAAVPSTFGTHDWISNSSTAFKNYDTRVATTTNINNTVISTDDWVIQQMERGDQLEKQIFELQRKLQGLGDASTDSKSPGSIIVSEKSNQRRKLEEQISVLKVEQCNLQAQVNQVLEGGSITTTVSSTATATTSSSSSASSSSSSYNNTTKHKVGNRIRGRARSNISPTTTQFERTANRSVWEQALQQLPAKNECTPEQLRERGDIVSELQKLDTAPGSTLKQLHDQRREYQDQIQQLPPLAECSDEQKREHLDLEAQLENIDRRIELFSGSSSDTNGIHQDHFM